MQNENTGEFHIKIGDNFEGPLDLLLSLIEKRKLCINDIALAEVTDGFIEYLKQFEEFPLQNGADFLIVASTLMLIKSLSLLPGISLSPEEKESIEELQNRLKLYQDIKDKSIFIKDNFGKKLIYFGGLKKKQTSVMFLPTEEISPANFLSAAMDIIKKLPKKEKLNEIKIKKVISLEDAIESLAKRIQSGLRMKFSEFAGKKRKDNSPEEIKAEKITIVVSFLAMLELVKRGAIQVIQETHFSDIHMETYEAKVPQYGINNQ